MKRFCTSATSASWFYQIIITILSLLLLSTILTSCSCPKPKPPPRPLTLEELREHYMHILLTQGILVVTLGETQRIIMPDDSIFAPYSANLLVDQHDRLDIVIELMRTYRIETVEVSAFTDDQFPADIEHHISDNQAHMVAEYLQPSESDARFIVPRGFGESNLVASNADLEGRYYNRRVEVTYRIYPPEILH